MIKKISIKRVLNKKVNNVSEILARVNTIEELIIALINSITSDTLGGFSLS